MNLFEAIKRRRSIRNYGEKELSETRLDEVEESIDQSRKLFSGVSAGVHLVRNGRALQENISGIIADYGKVEAPHYLVLTAEPTKKGFVEVGYRYEFTVLSLVARGLGTCWIGKGFRDEELSKYVRFPSNRTCITLIAFGPLPAGDDLYEIENPKRKELNHFLVNRDPGGLDGATTKIIDCVRRSPSSLNSQPWRLIFEEGVIHLYLRTQNKIARMFIKDMGKMNRVDAGIGLCHLEVGGKKFRDRVKVEEVPHPDKGDLSYVGSLVEG